MEGRLAHVRDSLSGWADPGVTGRSESWAGSAAPSWRPLPSAGWPCPPRRSLAETLTNPRLAQKAHRVRPERGAGPLPSLPRARPTPAFPVWLKDGGCGASGISSGKRGGCSDLCPPPGPSPPDDGLALGGAAGDQEFWVGWPPTTCPACACPGTGLGLCRTF